MASAWQDMVEMDKTQFAQLGKDARQRCLDKFTLEQQVTQHETLYETLYKHHQQAFTKIEQQLSIPINEKLKLR